jgi:lysophospholipase L1-like esterase
VRLRLFLIAAAAVLVFSCGSKGVKPTAPSPVIDDPVVSCPSDINVTTHHGEIPAITFDVPAADKGAPPITVACTPKSGSQFANGVTSVTCEATDSRQHKASCSFSVAITPAPLLTKTKFLAFGDSLTEGKPSLTFRGIVKPAYSGPDQFTFNSPGSYVNQLDALFSARYQDQTITIIADGLGGLSADDDKFRERADLDEFKPEALLLLEGTNNVLNATDESNISSAADALRQMVQNANARNVKVFLATLPRVNSHAPGYKNDLNPEAAVLALNARIISIAAAENVTLVDMYNAIPLSEIGIDGVHLTASGYKLMASEWLKAVSATLDVKP